MKRIVEETEEICTLCGGRGQEQSYETTAGHVSCRYCQGRGYIVTRRVTRTVTELGDVDDSSSGFRFGG